MEKYVQNKNLINLLCKSIYCEDSMIQASAMQVIIYVLKHLSNKKENFDIQLNIGFILDIFEKNI